MTLSLRRLQLPDGKTIVGYTSSELVAAMADKKFKTPRSQTSYRRATAQRALEVYSVKLDDTSDEAFIDSMVAVGMLTELQQP